MGSHGGTRKGGEAAALRRCTYSEYQLRFLTTRLGR